MFLIFEITIFITFRCYSLFGNHTWCFKRQCYIFQKMFCSVFECLQVCILVIRDNLYATCFYKISQAFFPILATYVKSDQKTSSRLIRLFVRQLKSIFPSFWFEKPSFTPYVPRLVLGSVATEHHSHIVRHSLKNIVFIPIVPTDSKVCQMGFPIIRTIIMNLLSCLYQCRSTW